MRVSEAVARRRSIREFEEAPVAPEVLRAVLEAARQAPSGGNLQPWHATVLTGERLAALARTMASVLAAGEPVQPEYRIYPEDLPEPYRARRAANGEAMYHALGLSREDRAGRLRQTARNFAFFGAPVGMLVHTPRFMGPPQWLDLGIWLQTVMLLLAEAGLGSCAQEAWSTYGAVVKPLAGIPQDHVLVCGLAIGHPRGDAAVNHFANPRAPLDDTVRFAGAEFAGGGAA